MLQHFALTGNTEQLVDYIGRMNEQIEIATRGVNTGNDAILDFMIEKAKREGTAITVKSSIPKEEFISIYDINILLSNLLDNAIEACESVNNENKFIELNTNYQANMFLIKMKNSKNPENIFTHKTTKKNKQAHGHGISIIDDIVKQQEGICSWEDKGEVFYSILYMKSTNQYSSITHV